MTQNRDVPEVEASEQEDRLGEPPISRRSLLAGSAGLTLGSLALAGGAAAQQRGTAVAAHGAPHGSPSGSLSNRAYPLTVTHEGVPDIARDPTDLPPPLPRRDPETVRVDLETVELEAHLAQGATYRYWTFLMPRFRGRSCACGSATPWRCICATTRTAG